MAPRRALFFAIALLAVASSGCTLIGAGIGATIPVHGEVKRPDVERMVAWEREPEVIFTLDRPPTPTPDRIVEGTFEGPTNNGILVRDANGTWLVRSEHILGVEIRDGETWVETTEADLEWREREGPEIRLSLGRVSWDGLQRPREPGRTEFLLIGKVVATPPGAFRVRRRVSSYTVDQRTIQKMEVETRRSWLEGAVVGAVIDLAVIAYVATHPIPISLGTSLDIGSR